MLPPYRQTVKQLQIMDLLATYRYDRLGHYADDAFVHAWQSDLATRFRSDLAVVESRIDRRNDKRVMPYPYLKPSLVPNSTSV
jgi:arachidonate 15-lipoxygenase